MNPACCRLSKLAQGICKSGCMFKEPKFVQYSCLHKYYTDECWAPCKNKLLCDCRPKKRNPKNEPKGLSEYKYYHEVSKL